MNFKISESPSSFLSVQMAAGERIITESGAFIYCNGEYKVQSKFELKSYKNWIAKIFGGKSLIYKVYEATENLELLLSTKDNAEMFLIEITNENAIIFEPDLHFARTEGVQMKFHKRDWKSTLNDGIKLSTSGVGQLFLKGYGKILAEQIDTEKEIFVDETALIAFEDSLTVKTISKGMKEMLTSGEGFIYSISGKGKIWLQTRQKSESSGGGGLVENLLSSVT